MLKNCTTVEHDAKTTASSVECIIIIIIIIRFQAFVVSNEEGIPLNQRMYSVCENYKGSKFYW